MSLAGLLGYRRCERFVRRCCENHKDLANVVDLAGNLLFVLLHLYCVLGNLAGDLANSNDLIGNQDVVLTINVWWG